MINPASDRLLREAAIFDVAGSDEAWVYLDELPLSQASVGYGALGVYGSLGYENKQVTVRGEVAHHALSTHPPAHLLFRLDECFRRFRCQVALNDDVQAGISSAHFAVLGDGLPIAEAAAAAGEPPRDLCADVRGVRVLELVVTSSQWEFCHAVWLDPQIEGTIATEAGGILVDCLGRVEISVPSIAPRTTRCIATVVSAGFADFLDDMLGSLNANGCCPDAAFAVFAVDPDEECLRVIAKYGAFAFRCQAQAQVNKNVKSVLYSAARVIDADQILCLDADMLVLGDLRPMFAMLEACPEGSILACREANQAAYRDLEHALCDLYSGETGDIARIVGTVSGEAAFPLVVNDGLFAGSRSAMLGLDRLLRGWRQAVEWIDERPDISWRNQFVFNLALAHLKCGLELRDVYNVQLNTQDVELRRAAGRFQAGWHGRVARVLHFNGNGRSKYPEWRHQFSRSPDPLLGAGDGDNYAEFLVALRTWVGSFGKRSLAWSFYGTTDGSDAQVRDPGTMPLLGLLHYLIRSNGCVRVLEAGTAKGVSTACLASAVCHRNGGLVVTFDPAPHAERVELWEALPLRMGACIEQRTMGSVEGMAQALAAGEKFEAALLDSLHTEEQVWAEFQLAAQLVVAGGLILIHDPGYALGTVEQALQFIEAAGYNVVRLWMAEGGVAEDDHLGLAVIENRRRLQARGTT